MKNAGIYARVSTKDQTTENQLIELRRFVSARGYNPIEFVDEGFSGALGADKRPGLQRLMEAAQKHHIDLIAVWDFSRFARTMKQLILALENFELWKVDFISYTQSIDTTTPTGRLIFGVFAALAEFERGMISQRVKSGMDYARERGRVFGRPRAPIDIERILALRKEGLSIRKIEQTTGSNRMTVYRTLKQMSVIS